MVNLVCPIDFCVLTKDMPFSLHCDKCGASYPLRNDIARFYHSDANTGQQQVADAFTFKWTRGEWGFRPEVSFAMRKFFFDRFGFLSENELEAFFINRTVLHAGIGSGVDEQIYLKYSSEVWGADISESVEAAQRNWVRHYPDLARKLHLVQADIMKLPFEDESFDIVLSDGVLHHTPDTFKALQAIVKKVRVGGNVVFYVYKKKSPVREFVDDFIREKLSHLTPNEAWRELESLTCMAKELSNARIDITIPEDVPLLGLRKGNFDLQRWLYWNFMKFYWNEAMTFDENNHVNFDWYYPIYAWRHTPEEVKGWLQILELQAMRFDVGDSGISVIATRN